MILNAKGERVVRVNVPKLDPDLLDMVEMTDGKLMIPCCIEQLMREIDHVKIELATIKDRLGGLETNRPEGRHDTETGTACG